MKKTFLLFVLINSLLIECSNELFAQVPVAKGSWQWVKGLGSGGQLGGSNSMDERINMMKTDKHGNTYVCGQVFGFANIQGLNGGNAYAQTSLNSNLQSYQKLMGFVAKYDCKGNLMWFKTLTDSTALYSGGQIFDLTIDTAGNTYAAGYYEWAVQERVFWGDSIIFNANTTGNNVSNGIILKINKYGKIVWRWTPEMQWGYAINSRRQLGNYNTLYAEHYSIPTSNFILLSHDTLTLLAGYVDTLLNRFGYIYDFNTNNGHLLGMSKMSNDTGYYTFEPVGFGAYGDGTFITAVRLASPINPILDSVLLAPSTAGGYYNRVAIIKFNRTHLIAKSMFYDTSNIASANFEDLKNGYEINASTLRGMKVFGNYISASYASFGNGNVPLLKFSSFNKLQWGLDADSCEENGTFFPTKHTATGEVCSAVRLTGRVKIQGKVFTTPSNFQEQRFMFISGDSGKIESVSPPLITLQPNSIFSNSNYAALSNFNLTEKGEIISYGNLHNNSVVAKDTSIYFGGNNDMFVIKYGYDCATDSALIAPIASDGIKATCMVDSIKITWNDNSNIEWGYHIYRATGSRNATYNLIATLPTNTTIFFDNSISASTNYWYKVAAYNNIGDATMMNIDSSMSCKTVGINQVNKNSFVGNIYPNPTQTGEFTLSIQSNETGKAQLQISNYMGQIILDKEVQLNNTNQWHLDLSKYLSGTYLVTLKTSSGNFVERVMVVK